VGWLDRKANVEVATISGVLRVEVHAGINWLSVIFEIVLFGFFVRAIASSWLKLSFFDRIFNAWIVAAGVVGVFHLLRHSELIEFDRENLTIRRTFLGWERTSRYRVDDLSELTWRVQEGENHFALECKAGMRRIQFGQYVTEQQAQEILAALQQSLPDVAQKMGMSSDDQKSHITQLGLS
jgi:hypothetical protein